ncbi:MAG: C4-type zinc ribbon domain-containing protein [Coriobacteriia bacterium]|nr:C4-type zinc ribbon domain-containing protein [Coriobacteriia bacterium]
MSDGDTLVALTEQDLEIARSEKALDELPEKRAVLQLRKRLREIEAVRNKAQAYCHKLDAMITHSNDDATSIQTKIDAEQAKVLSGEVTNPKELQNLTRELDALKRRKDAIEFEELGLMEKAEAGTAQLEKVEAALTEGAAREAGLIAEFKAKGGELQTRIGRMREDREKLAKTLPADLRARYESLRESKHGIAVGILKGELCTACRTQIPSHEAQALHAGPEVAECPNCKRLLVVGLEAE